MYPDVPTGVFRAEFVDNLGDWDGYSYAINKGDLLKDIRARTETMGDKLISEPKVVLVPVGLTVEIHKAKGHTMRTNRDLAYKKRTH